MRFFKNVLFRWYVFYLDHFPVARGKEFVGRVITRLFGECIITVEGVLFKVSVRSRLDRELLRGKRHDLVVFNLIEKLKPDSLFFDVGANCGYFTVLANKKFGARVYAFEPSPRELRRLYENLILNDCSNVTVIPSALGRQFEFKDLNIAEADNPGMNSFVNLSAIRGYCGRHRTVVGQLDDFVGARELAAVVLVKIDVEGFELEVLNGFERAMPQLTQATFVVEITPSYLALAGARAEDIYAFFKRHGFRAEVGLRADRQQWDEVFVCDASVTRPGNAFCEAVPEAMR